MRGRGVLMLCGSSSFRPLWSGIPSRLLQKAVCPQSVSLCSLHVKGGVVSCVGHPRSLGNQKVVLLPEDRVSVNEAE